MTIAEISDVLAWGASTAYVIAMIVFAMVLVTGRGVLPADVDPAATQTSTARREKLLGIARSVVILGALLHLVAVITRGIAAGRAPWANMYEFALVGSFVAMAAFLVVAFRYRAWFLGAPITGVVVAFLVVGLTQFHVVADGVQPALQSYWLVLHVGVAVGGAGLFTVGMAFTVLQLLKDSYDTTKRQVEGEPNTTQADSPAPVSRQGVSLLRWRWLAGLPRASTLEVLSFRVNAVGFVLWTFTLISGAIWAENAWGRYWQWDPKEVWSFIIWVVYAAYLHARATKRWTGRRAAYLVLVGYACVIFNFAGVNLLLNSKHSYSGL